MNSFTGILLSTLLRLKTIQLYIFEFYEQHFQGKPFSGCLFLSMGR